MMYRWFGAGTAVLPTDMLTSLKAGACAQKRRAANFASDTLSLAAAVAASARHLLQIHLRVLRHAAMQGWHVAKSLGYEV